MPCWLWKYNSPHCNQIITGYMYLLIIISLSFCYFHAYFYISLCLQISLHLTVVGNIIHNTGSVFVYWFLHIALGWPENIIQNDWQDSAKSDIIAMLNLCHAEFSLWIQYYFAFTMISQQEYGSGDQNASFLNTRSHLEIQRTMASTVMVLI